MYGSRFERSFSKIVGAKDIKIMLKNDDFHYVASNEECGYVTPPLKKDEYHLCDRVFFSTLPSDGIYPTFAADIWLNVPNVPNMFLTDG